MKTKKPKSKMVRIAMFCGNAKKPFDILELKEKTYEGLLLMCKADGLTLQEMLMKIMLEDIARGHPPARKAA